MIRPPFGTNDTREIITSEEYERELAEAIALGRSQGLSPEAAEARARDYLDANYEVDDDYVDPRTRGIYPAAGPKAGAQ